jgi:hypothetical protein
MDEGFSVQRGGKDAALWSAVAKQDTALDRP